MHHFTIPDMTCSACAKAVTGAVKGLDAHAEVRVDLDRKVVDVKTAHTSEVVAAAIEGAGFSVVRPV
jgi:copper chaperone